MAVRTFVTIRGLWDASTLPTDADTLRHHRYLALAIGAVFGFVFGLTSVGAGAFFGMALVTSMRFSSIAFLMIGSIPGILIGSQLTLALPERALRGSLASVLALFSLKMLGAF